MEARTLDYGGIGWAVNHLRHGHRMRRREWPTGQFVVLVTPDKSSPVTQRYLAIRTAGGNQFPWTSTPADLLAADWLMADPVQPGHTSITDAQVQQETAKPVDVEVISTS